MPVLKNLDANESAGTHWTSFYVNAENVTYFWELLEFNIFHKQNRKFIGNKDILTNVYKIQACKSIICIYVFIGFVDIMLKDKH